MEKADRVAKPEPKVTSAGEVRALELIEQASISLKAGKLHDAAHQLRRASELLMPESQR